MKYLFIVALLLPSTPTYASDHGHAPAKPTPPAAHGHDAHHPAPAKKEEKKHVHWSYGGKEGPEHWASLDTSFAACAEGHEQSPVDLKWSKQKGSRKLEFHYAPGPLTVVDNGHTIQVNVPLGSHAMIDGVKYSLAQFHFHAASEHTFSGKHFPLEVHFVHKDAEGKLAVVGVMFETGARNPGLDPIFAAMPKAAGQEKKLTAKYDPASLLPKSFTHYQYRGSLTTPPCSEGVNWTVLNSPVPISEEQLLLFQKAYVNNNRPVQPLHERFPASY